jgi:hypothetical protein
LTTWDISIEHNRLDCEPFALMCNCTIHVVLLIVAVCHRVYHLMQYTYRSGRGGGVLKEKSSLLYVDTMSYTCIGVAYLFLMNNAPFDNLSENESAKNKKMHTCM